MVSARYLWGVVLAAGLAGTGFARPAQYGAAYPYPAPPAGFRPGTASDARLLAYGLPAHPARLADGRSSNPALDHALSVARNFIPAHLAPALVRHGPARLVTGTPVGTSAGSEAAAAIGQQYSTNWAGETLENGSTGWNGGSYAEVLAQWVISRAQQAEGACSGTDYSATWVGIDGTYGSTDVMQAGTEADATCSGNVTGQNIYAWFEWYPADGYEITNFPVAVGGSVFVVVQASGPESGTATFVNLQTGAYTSVGLSPPAGTSLRGNVAEFIVERPSINNTKTLGTLSDFGEIPMESEIGYLLNQINTPYYSTPGAPEAGQTGDTVTMQNGSGVTIATTVPQGPSAQLVQVAGPTE